VRKTLVLILAIALVLVVSGCSAEEPTTTATSMPTTTIAAAPTTTASSSTSTSTSTTATTISTVAATFTAQLSGSEVVPAVDTLATGSATFTIDPSGTKAHFVLKVSNISDVIASRVHEGEPGASGRGLLILYPGPTLSGPFTGTLAEGNFNSSVLIGSLTGDSIADFAALLASGQAYVNVGTMANPEGEIRGQIR